MKNKQLSKPIREIENQYKHFDKYDTSIINGKV